MKSRIFSFNSVLLFIAVFSAIANSANAEIYFHSAQDALNCARAFCKEYDLQEQYLAQGVKLAKKSVGAFLPTLDFSWSEKDTVPIGGDDYRVKTIGAGITQKLFDGGKSFLEYKMQINMSKLEFYGFKQTYQNFEGEVVRLYYQNILAIAKSRVQAEAVQNANSVLQFAQIQLEEGMITKTDYLKALVSYGKMELQLKAFNDQKKASERELIEVLGCPAKEKIVFCDKDILPQEIELSQKKSLQKEKALFVQCAIENSIDLKKLDAEIDWAKKQRAIQKMIFMPSLSVSGGVEFSGQHYPLTTPSYTLKLTVGFENNPWLATKASSGASFKEKRMNSADSAVSGQGTVNTTYFTQMRMSKINLSQKVLSRQKAISKIENSVAELLENIEQNTENLALNFEVLKLSQANIELQKIQLEEGLITKTDFLDAIKECAEQKIQVLELCNQLDYLQTQLEILTGRKIKFLDF